MVVENSLAVTIEKLLNATKIKLSSTGVDVRDIQYPFIPWSKKDTKKFANKILHSVKILLVMNYKAIFKFRQLKKKSATCHS
jgi:hypothetical protein